MSASDPASALDVVATGARENQGRIVHLHFKGVTTDQARAFTRSIELHGEGKNASLVRASIDAGDSRGLTMLGELRGQRWRWSEAQIKPVQPLTARVRAFEADIIVKPQGVVGQVQFRLKLAFNEARVVSAQMWARMELVIMRWLEGLTNLKTDVDLLVASQRLMRDLKAIDPLIRQVETRITHEAGDLIVVERDDKSGGFLAD